MKIRISLIGLAATAALAFAACGSEPDNGISRSEAKKLEQQADELREKANRLGEDVRSGKVDAEEAAAELQKDSTDLAQESLEAAKDSNLPDDIKQELEEAQKQLEAANGN
jgi:gas vesicle protein